MTVTNRFSGLASRIERQSPATKHVHQQPPALPPWKLKALSFLNDIVCNTQKFAATSLCGTTKKLPDFHD